MLLLFYLAPLWTVLLARLLLGERAGRWGLQVILLSLAGAAVMLWQPRLGLPLPGNDAEWLGLAAGFLFALSNVLIRRTPQHSIELKSTAVFLCTVTLGLVAVAFEPAAAVASAQALALEAVGHHRTGRHDGPRGSGAGRLLYRFLPHDRRAAVR